MMGLVINSMLDEVGLMDELCLVDVQYLLDEQCLLDHRYLLDEPCQHLDGFDHLVVHLDD